MRFIVKWIISYIAIMFAMSIDNLAWIPADRKWFHTKEWKPHFHVMFILPGKFSDLEGRLDARPGISPEEKELRLKNAVREISEKVAFDVEILNVMGELDVTVNEIAEVIRREA